MQRSFACLVEGLDLKDYDDWVVFDQRLKAFIREGQARRIPALKMIHGPDEEWYLNESSGEIYVYGLPDEKIRAKWEPVDVFALKNKEEAQRSGLAAIPIRQRNSLQTESLKQFLTLLVAHGVAVIVERPKAASISRIETWYRDVQSQIAYRLVEKSDGSSIWERAPSSFEEEATQ
jgi:hypothetical protein